MKLSRQSNHSVRHNSVRHTIAASKAATRIKPIRSKLQTHASILMWKSYLQRQRRWRLLAIETFIGGLLFLVAIFIARPVFLTTLEAEPEAPLAAKGILASLRSKTILGYAPNVHPYASIMSRAAELLNTTFLAAKTEMNLNEELYKKSEGTPIKNPIIWVIWKGEANNKWEFSIRSTERARYMTEISQTVHHNPHLRAGFLAVQMAISQSIVEFVASSEPKYEVNLVAMPVSPLMLESRVRKAISLIILCFTLALLPAVLETEALVVWETRNMFKRALRMRNVSYPSMYLSWLVYAYLTALPVCVLGAITIILTFRWIHLITALLTLLAYESVMTVLALMMAMFHNKSHIACIWTTLFTLLQMYLAELLVHHQYDTMHVALTFFLHLILPPLGLLNAFNEFALLSTGRTVESKGSLLFMVASWGLLIVIYFMLLMLLQRTIGQQRAIGGQVSWKSIIFKRSEDREELHHIEHPTRFEVGKLQEVDEYVAVAISFRDVCKAIMGIPMLSNLTFDVYRGEYTIMYTEKIQEQMMETIDDLLTGLTVADKGEIRVLGEHLDENYKLLNMLYMMGYCHRSETLVDDLTVQEHFTLFSTICLWAEPPGRVVEYGQIRYRHLLKECNLHDVRHTRIRDLGIYYRAQLCWALARLLEPRVIIIPVFRDDSIYRSVIIDKIMQYKKHITIIALYHSSLQIEFGDRIFVFDNKILVFGGTPAYMFFRYGREYHIRLILRVGDTDESECTKLLLARVHDAGATVRAHLGSLLVLRLRAIPTAPVAALIKDLTENPTKYGLTTSINVSVPDSDEVVTRAINDSRQAQYKTDHAGYERIKQALKRFREPTKWKRNKNACTLHFDQIANKFTAFHKHHRILFVLTLISALVSGLLLGLSISSGLAHLAPGQGKTHQFLKHERLTVESKNERTTLVMRVGNSLDALSIAKAYTMSETNSTEKEVEKIFYVALPHKASFIEYLVTRAIDSPQHYVYVYAYGMDVYTKDKANQSLMIQALYSPLHHDNAAAARSIARVYMALIRHYTGQLDATIQVDDDPLALDLSPWMKGLAQPPLFLQFLLILTISHITLLPSMEYGLIRHLQKHAMNFSPIRYWLTLYFCDLLFFWVLVGLMSISSIGIMYLTVSHSLFQYYDLLVLPFMLVLYGLGCVPQAYVFSLRPQVALNIMTFVIVNMVFGETTIFAKLLYGDFLSYALDFMSLSPQFNMAYAYVKIKQIFLYNTECIIFQAENLCLSNSMHKCCAKCGVLQECFSRKGYLTQEQGILMEVIAMFATAAFFTVLLLLIEYRIFYMLWLNISNKLYNKDKINETLRPGTARETRDVNATTKSICRSNQKLNIKIDTFGEYLCANDITRIESGMYIVRNVYLGLGKGEAVAISGLKAQGRLDLCEILAGYRLPADGNVYAMSKYKLSQDPHLYSRQISFCSENSSLPSWMTVRESLIMIGVLRGVPRYYAHQESRNLIEALDLSHLANTLIKDLVRNALVRLHFAAAIIGAPPIIILDEVAGWQKFAIRRVMNAILAELRRRGHAILVASSTVEKHVILYSRLAFMIDGTIYDVDTVDNLVKRYSPQGYTVVVHLKDEVDIDQMFSRYFTKFQVNDVSEVLINVQILDADVTWKTLFEKMEQLQADNYQVYSYIVSATSIDYIYNYILCNEKGLTPATGFFTWRWAKKIISSKPKRMPSQEYLDLLRPFERKYDITTLKGLPWSVIFHTGNPPP